MTVFFPDKNKKVFNAGGKSFHVDDKLIGPGSNNYGRDLDPSKLKLSKPSGEAREKLSETLRDILDAQKVTGKKQTQERVVIFGYDPIIRAPF